MDVAIPGGSKPMTCDVVIAGGGPAGGGAGGHAGAGGAVGGAAAEGGVRLHQRRPFRADCRLAAGLCRAGRCDESPTEVNTSDPRAVLSLHRGLGSLFCVVQIHNYETVIDNYANLCYTSVYHHLTVAQAIREAYDAHSHQEAGKPVPRRHRYRD